MPTTARNAYHRETGIIDGEVWIRFDASPQAIRKFLAQKPFANAEWESYPSGKPSNTSFPDGRTLQPPYRSTGIKSDHVYVINVDVEEPKTGDWTVWLSWFKD